MIKCTIIKWFPSTSEFQEKTRDGNCESCEPTEIAIEFTREEEQEKKDFLYLFILFLYRAVKSQLVWFLRFLALMFFWSFLPSEFFIY